MKKIILLIAASLLFAVNTQAQEKKPLPDQASDRAKANIEKLIEKDYYAGKRKDRAWMEESKIKFHFWGEEEGTVEEARKLGMLGLEKRGPKEMTRLFYPKLMVTKGKAKFLDKNGKVNKEVKGKYRGASKDLKLFAFSRDVRERTREEKFKNLDVEEIITIVDEDGNKLWESKPGYYDGIIPNVSGDSFIDVEYLSGEFSGDITIHGLKGLLKRTHLLPKDRSLSGIRMGFSEDGKYYAASVGMVEPEATLWDIDGNVIWRTTMPYKGYKAFGDRSVHVANNGEYVSVVLLPPHWAAPYVLVVLDKSGQIVIEHEFTDITKGNKFMGFSKDGSRLIVVFYAHGEIKRGKIIVTSFDTSSGSVMYSGVNEIDSSLRSLRVRDNGQKLYLEVSSTTYGVMKVDLGGQK